MSGKPDYLKYDGRLPEPPIEPPLQYYATRLDRIVEQIGHPDWSLHELTHALRRLANEMRGNHGMDRG